MKRFPAKTGPYPIRLVFETDEIDDMCSEELHKANLLPTKPEAIRIERFVEKRFTKEVGFEELPPGCMGYTAFGKDGSILAVRVSSRIVEDETVAAERRVRSTWAHEAGHCLLHPSLFIEEATLGFGEIQNAATALKERRFLCRAGDIHPVTHDGFKKYDGRWWEWQANRAIGGFLLPKPLVLQAAEPFLKRSLVTGSPRLPAAARPEAERKLADIFDVNPVAVRIRLQEMFPDQDSSQIEF
jgi:hypothetical protein